MAFKTKKRLPAQDTGNETDSTTSSIGGNNTSSNVVATQSWVVNALKRFWDWTRFFATEQLKVAGSINSGRVKTCELETNDLYAHRFMLLDDDGRPAVITLKNGILDVDYDFQDVFMYSGELPVFNYVWRFPDSTIDNFIGLTPYETYVNFIPFTSNENAEMEGKTCPRLCSADGKDELASKFPLLVKCPRTRRIARLEVLDEDGELVKSIEIPETEGSPTRILTINMPCFKRTDDDSVEYVCLPSSGTIEEFNNNGVIPPFLKPTDCECGCHHPFVPPAPETLSPDIFDDTPIQDQEPLFDDVPDGGNGWMDFDETTKDQYETSYENYATRTYSNVVLKKSDFNLNQKQFLSIVTETV